MVGVSLLHRGAELLGRVDELERYANQGSTLGIPLLHPWANRLSGFRYAVAGRAVALDPGSPLLHLDGNGRPIHGVPGAHLAWTVDGETGSALTAHLDWSRGELLALFPFPHRLEVGVHLYPDRLEIETVLVATEDVPVPVAFGYHPYLALPDAPRDAWTVELPPMRRLLLDERGIPTGAEEPFPGLAGVLDRDYDDGFAGLPEQPRFAVAGGGRRVEVAFLHGYRYAQVYAPPGERYVCFEPMTAPTNALLSGSALSLVDPGGSYRAAFSVAVWVGS